MSNILPKEERDEILSTLSDGQRDFIQNQVKRGKKTVFANEMAKDKGMVLPENIDSNELEHLLDEWVLVDYIDNGFVNPDTPCECGKALRYQYIVKHKSTNEVRRFGITHFEEHTELSAEVVRKIKNGFQTIEYEMDELLTKIKNGWELNNQLPFIPKDYVFPTDIEQHIEAGVPLLDRQIKRLKQQVLSFIQEERESSDRQDQSTDAGKNDMTSDSTGTSSSYETELLGEEITSGAENAVAISLFGEDETPDPKNEKDLLPYVLDVQYRDKVMKYLDEGVSSARIITELLIKNDGAPNKRYSSGKPKLYVGVCFYLDLLVTQEKAAHIGKQGQDDRYYKII